MKVYLSEYIHPEARAKLEAHAEIVTTWADIENIDAAIIRIAPVTRDIMSRAKKLKVIGKHGVGCNSIDLEAAKELGITVFNTPLANTNSVAELIVGLLLTVGRNIHTCDAVTRGEGFPRIAPPEMTGVELTGKTLGLIGLGNISRRTAEIMKAGFSVKVIGYDPYCTKETAEELGIEKLEELNDLLAASDFISISVPLTESTKNMISRENLSFCKPSAILINAARGGIVNEVDLYEALKNKTIRAAACDAFVDEPPTGKNPLMSLPNFVATPHIGANTEDALIRMGQGAVDGVLLALEGKEPPSRVV